MELDWKLIGVVLGTLPGFWENMAQLAEDLPADPVIGGFFGFAHDRGQRGKALWNGVVSPMFERYGRRQPDLRWNRRLAQKVVAHWRGLQTSELVPRQTIAPLENLRGLQQPVKIDKATVIRPMTDEDRDELWRNFGGVSPIPYLTPEQLDSWTDVIDDKSGVDRLRPFGEDVLIDRISTVVTALRLHHPGVVGTTFVWTRPDPPDAPLAGRWGRQSLFALNGAGTFEHPLRTDIGPGDRRALRELFLQLLVARRDRAVALALRRFDGAYERRNQEDALVDLWIAFEALLVPDSTQELSYRAALRLARLAGRTAAEREDAFDLARSSYKVRSKVVHGELPPDDLSDVVDKTRQLARTVLRTWVMRRPTGGVNGLDRAMLA